LVEIVALDWVSSFHERIVRFLVHSFDQSTWDF
jgi:hypothetical protein